MATTFPSSQFHLHFATLNRVILTATLPLKKQKRYFSLTDPPCDRFRRFYRYKGRKYFSLTDRAKRFYTSMVLRSWVNRLQLNFVLRPDDDQTSPSKIHLHFATLSFVILKNFLPSTQRTKYFFLNKSPSHFRTTLTLVLFPLCSSSHLENAREVNLVPLPRHYRFSACRTMRSARL